MINKLLLELFFWRKTTIDIRLSNGRPQMEAMARKAVSLFNRMQGNEVNHSFIT
jgi:hypothetical protein